MRVKAEVGGGRNPNGKSQLPNPKRSLVVWDFGFGISRFSECTTNFIYLPFYSKKLGVETKK
jgi:hypothetical protein